MTPQTAVEQLAEIVATRSAFTAAEIYSAMAAREVPKPIADRAYKFTQIAWARAFLASLGVQQTPDYLCFNASGEVVESGFLTDEPCFAAALRLVDQYAGSPGCRLLAMMSADFVAVSKQLDAGADPHDLVIGSAFVFLEKPTPAGIANFQQAMASHAAVLRARAGHDGESPSKKEASTQDAVSAKKPWWRFWT